MSCAIFLTYQCYDREKSDRFSIALNVDIRK